MQKLLQTGPTLGDRRKPSLTLFMTVQGRSRLRGNGACVWRLALSDWCTF